jgi:1,2-phenylacetyl-CoA epoxidase PaaB subunit
MSQADAERSFEVFARHDREPELRHIGQVRAAGERDAVVFAYTLYDERRWQDMFVVATDAMHQLVRPA